MALFSDLLFVKKLKSASVYVSFFVLREAIKGKMEMVNADTLVRSN